MHHDLARGTGGHRDRGGAHLQQRRRGRAGLADLRTDGSDPERRPHRERQDQSPRDATEPLHETPSSTHVVSSLPCHASSAAASDEGSCTGA